MPAYIKMTLLALFIASCAAGQNTPPTPDKNPAPVFALFQVPFGPEIVIDPLFLLSGKGIIPFPDPKGMNPRKQAIFKTYVHSGAQYTIVYGGADMGRVVVRAVDPRWFPGARVELHSRVPIRGATMGLAVDASVPLRTAGSRRDPSSNERARAMLLAKSIFRARGVPSSDFTRLEIDQINVMPLSTDIPEIVVSASIGLPDKDGSECTVFFIGRENSPEADVLWYQHPKEINEIQELALVDVIDIDGDGVNELIVKRFYYEGFCYEVYKYLQGRWKKVFSTWVRVEFSLPE